jgi:hypothetical protein
MSTSYQVVGANSDAPFSRKTHSWEDLALLGVNWHGGNPPRDFLGFAIEYREPAAAVSGRHGHVDGDERRGVEDRSQGHGGAPARLAALYQGRFTQSWSSRHAVPGLPDPGGPGRLPAGAGPGCRAARRATGVPASRP